MTKQTTKKVSAIDAIIHPFSFESKSTQVSSEPKQINLGGKVVSTSVFNKKKNDWETITKTVGGKDVVVSHRIRKGKTAKDRKATVREKEVIETPKKGKKK